jgi:hypothetical protein
MASGGGMGNFGNNNGGNTNGIMLTGVSPPLNVRQSSFASYSVDGNGPDSSLVSFLYEWQRKLFLVPDCGFDPFDDPMSLEGQARIYRLVIIFISVH